MLCCEETVVDRLEDLVMSKTGPRVQKPSILQPEIKIKEARIEWQVGPFPKFQHNKSN